MEVVNLNVKLYCQSTSVYKFDIIGTRTMKPKLGFVQRTVFTDTYRCKNQGWSRVRGKGDFY